MASEEVRVKPFHKDQGCQCNITPHSLKLFRTSSLDSLSQNSIAKSGQHHYSFNVLQIKKPSGSRPSLGLTFDRDDNRPPILRSIDPNGCFANVQDISPGDRLLFVDNCLYGVKTLSEIKQHFLSTAEGTLMTMCWLRRSDNCRSSACCSPKCLVLRERIEELNHIVQKIQRDSSLEESHEKTELLRIQSILSESLRKAHTAIRDISAEVDSLKEASQLLQLECDEQVKQLRSRLSDKEAEVNALTVCMGEVNHKVHPEMPPLNMVPSDPREFVHFFQRHRELYRRHLLDSINENAKLQSQCATSEGEVLKLTRQHSEQISQKDAEIERLKGDLEKEKETSRESIKQLDEVYVRNLTLEEQLTQKQSEILSLAQTQDHLVSIASQGDEVDDLRRRLGETETELIKANSRISSLQLQNSSLKTQLKGNEQSLQELQHSLLSSDSGFERSTNSTSQ